MEVASTVVLRITAPTNVLTRTVRVKEKDVAKAVASVTGVTTTTTVVEVGGRAAGGDSHPLKYNHGRWEIRVTTC